MYFIVKGDCEVKVKDKIGEAVEEVIHKTLGAGDHFGVRIHNTDFTLMQK